MCKLGPVNRLLSLFAVILLALVGPTACAAADPYARAQRIVTLPDGRKMNLYCEGKKGPVVVLDAGLGGTTWSWSSLQDQLAERFQACAYDRAGMGFSDPGPMPRDAAHRTDDLRALLKASGLPGPYILVGHSMGAINIQLYAFQTPQEVAGLVLVDPSVAHQAQRLSDAVGQTAPGDGNGGRRACLEAAEAGLKRGTPDWNTCVGQGSDSWSPEFRAAMEKMRTSPDFFRAEVSEFDSLAGADSDQLDAAHRSLGDMPLIVLTAENTYRTGIPPAYANLLSAQWMAMHDELARLSSRGVNRLVAGSGHLMQNEKPDAIVAAVREVAAQAKKP
jgi:pimeloyl-ACP methyl ester carboxylesterase